EVALSFLRDRYDGARGVARGRGYNCLCNAHTLQSVLFFPDQERVLLSHGGTPAPAAKFRELRLAQWWATGE
ncbi:MAG: hypothetical protein HYV26_02615, partial [Candidatus Hydrogenedentes bacterium]|nr:hypothetical protein [Candidatus Hydrogenedentota bacterium]